MRETVKHHVQFKTTIETRSGYRVEANLLNENHEALLSFEVNQFSEGLSKQHSAYAEIEWELDKSKHCFLRSKDHVDDDLVRSALFSEAVMSYGRVFNSAKGRNGVKLEGSSYWIGDDKTSKKRHFELMDFRNQLIAHTGVSPYRTCKSFVVTNLISTGQTVSANSLPRSITFGIAPLKLSLTGIGADDIDDTILYLDMIISKVQSKLKLLESKITELVVESLLVKE